MSESPHIFVSVGSTCNVQQEAFVCAVEARLRAEGLMPHTVGRDTFSADAPIKAITSLMDSCSGTVVIALERLYFPKGIEKRGGPKETPLIETAVPTPWNQIEAAMAYSRSLPLLMIVQKGLRSEGLLERGYDWYVQEVPIDSSALSTLEFNGILSNWKEKVLKNTAAVAEPEQSSPDIEKLTIGQIVSGMKPAQLWSALAAFFGLLAGAFALGAKLAGGK